MRMTISNLRHEETPMRRPTDHIPGLAVATAIVVLGNLAGCGGQTVEPMPDIPEKTVEYDTVKLEYGEEDGVQKKKSQPVRQAMVGEKSGLALLSRATVFRTNVLMWYVFWLKRQVLKQRPKAHDEDEYVWWGWPNGKFVRFRVRLTGEDSHSYKMWFGDSRQDNAELFRGTFTLLSEEGEKQQGYGRLHFNWDTAHEYTDEKTQGKMTIAFRSRNNVRQVRVMYDKFKGKDAEKPIDAINRYVQLSSGRTRFKFFGRSDYEQEMNEPKKKEFFSVDAAWLGDKRGRIAGRIGDGNLDMPFRIGQCWDESEKVVWEKRSAPFKGEEGDKAKCAARLKTLKMDPPTYSKPDGPPAVPEPHASE